MAILRVIRGNPGSGKTQFAYRQFPGVFHIENDMFHMHNDLYDWHKENMPDAINWCIQMVKTALENNMDVVVCNTFTKKRFVEEYEKIALEYGAKFEVYRCQGNFQNVHGLSSKMVESFKNAMEDWPGEILVKQLNKFKILHGARNTQTNRKKNTND